MHAELLRKPGAVPSISATQQSHHHQLPLLDGILYIPALSTGRGNGMSSTVQMDNHNVLCAAVGQVWMQVS